jgi:hypothetical protein
MLVRRAASTSSEAIHRALFPEGPPAAKSLDQIRAGLRKRMQQRRPKR